MPTMDDRRPILEINLISSRVQSGEFRGCLIVTHYTMLHIKRQTVLIKMLFHSYLSTYRYPDKQTLVIVLNDENLTIINGLDGVFFFKEDNLRILH
jgi:hypothetical protein